MKVFINAIPKAGTNLVAKCLDLAGLVQAGHIGGGRLRSKNTVSLVRRLLGKPLVSEGYLVGLDFPTEIRRSRIDWLLKRIRDRQYITAHVGYIEDLLWAVKRHGFRVIVVIRDPRAVVSSMVPYILRSRWHPLHSLFVKLSVEECYRIAYQGYFDDKIAFPSIVNKYLAVEPWIRSDDVLVVKFEELVGAKGGGSDELQTNILEELCSHVRISLNYLPTIKEHLFGPSRSTFRKGQVNSWKEEIPSALQERMNIELKNLLARWGYMS